MPIEILAHDLPQDAGSLAVDEAHPGQAGEIGAIQVLVQRRSHILGTPAAHVEFHARRIHARQNHRLLVARRRSRQRPRLQAQPAGVRAQPEPAHPHFRITPIDAEEFAGLLQRGDVDPIPHLQALGGGCGFLHGADGRQPFGQRLDSAQRVGNGPGIGFSAAYAGPEPTQVLAECVQFLPALFAGLVKHMPTLVLDLGALDAQLLRKGLDVRLQCVRLGQGAFRLVAG